MITHEPIDLHALTRASDPAVGAQVVFSGVVRNHHEGKSVLKLMYECYEPMALKEIQKIIFEARKQWPLYAVRVLHRVGEISIGEIAVVVITEAAHRAEAYAANVWIMDAIKNNVPIWKKELYTDGLENWIQCDCVKSSYDEHQTFILKK